MKKIHKNNLCKKKKLIVSGLCATILLSVSLSAFCLIKASFYQNKKIVPPQQPTYKTRLKHTILLLSSKSHINKKQTPKTIKTKNTKNTHDQNNLNKPESHSIPSNQSDKHEQVFNIPPSITKPTLGAYTAISINNILRNSTNLPQPVIQEAIKSYMYATKRGLVKNKNFLTIVDFSKPSYLPRMYIVNLNTRQLINTELVAQGRNSGRGAFATHFSNMPASYQSSLGTYITQDQPFFGEHGKSLRLIGIEPGINNNAESRGIIIHNAWYVTKPFAKKYHRVGNSLGCFAISKTNIKQTIKLIKGGSVLFAYAPAELHDSIINNL